MAADAGELPRRTEARAGRLPVSAPCRWATRRIPPGGRLRPHSHGDQVELQICGSGGAGTWSRTGSAIASSRGPRAFLGPDVKHEIVNESGDEDLVMMWLISPAGLEDFFRAIGRARTPGEPARLRSSVPRTWSPSNAGSA